MPFIRVDIPDPLANSVGGKGLGEAPIIPTPAAIANGVFDAIGVRITDLPKTLSPMTPDRVLRALRAPLLCGGRGRGSGDDREGKRQL